MPDHESLPSSVQRYATVVRRQWWVTVLVTVVAIIAAGVYVQRATPVYSASMKFVVGQGQTLFAPGLSVNVQPFTQTITDLLQSQVVARETISQLGLHTAPASLLNQLSITTRPDTSVINVTYNDTDRQRAVRVLSTLASIFTSTVNNVLAGKSASSSTPGQASQPVSVVIFDPAHPNPGRVSPKTVRTLVIAALLGLIAGLLLAFLRDALSSRIRSEPEAEAAYGAPVIGSLPRGALGLTIDAVGELPPKLGGRIGEAFQMLTARLRYSSGLKRGIIVVTSARAEEGKTTVAAHVAALLAASGNDVIAVEADLHRPALHRLLDVEPGQPGLRDVVVDGLPVTSVLIRVTAKSLAAADRVRRAAVVGAQSTSDDPDAEPSDELTDNGKQLEQRRCRLRFLPAGVAAATPLHILSLGHSALLLSRLRALSDYVVIDTPPLLLSGDTYPLLQMADFVLVVSREQITLHDEARRARKILGSLGVTDVSVAISESASAGRTDYYGHTEGS